MDKKQIAKLKMDARSNLNESVRKTYDASIHSQVLTFVENYRSVALFASFGHEIKTNSLIKKLLKKNYQVYLPKVEGKVMNFYEIHSLNDLVKSSFGILEPRLGNPIKKDLLDVIVVPMLAYNKDKFRVGYGGGYYDKYLKDYSGIKLGIAYSFQYTEEDFVENHDVACDYIATERG